MLSRRLPGLLLATLGCSFVLASPPPEAWNAPYPEKTAALAAKGDAARGASAFEICQGCHRVGALGRPDGSYPRLAGQHATVLIKQLTDVRSERRGNPKMLPFADHQALTVQDIADIAAYLQALPVPATQGQGPGTDLAHGQRLYERDCQICHGPRGEARPNGSSPGFPASTTGTCCARASRSATVNGATCIPRCPPRSPGTATTSWPRCRTTCRACRYRVAERTPDRR